MREMFPDDLQEVQTRLVEIAESVVDIIENGTVAFCTTDKKKAKYAIAAVEDISEKALALDELVIQILSLRSPVARDLRILVSALRISNSLERMAAYGGHIASIALYRYPSPAVPESMEDTFDEMSRVAVRLARKTQKLLKNTSVDLARKIQAEDARVDELHLEVFEMVLSPKWGENAVNTVDVTLASRYLERFADHVVDISSKVSYLTTGDWSDADLEED
jgi:phosphate transport system protein